MVWGIVLAGLYSSPAPPTERKSPAPVALAAPANFLYINPPTQAALAVGGTFTLQIKVANFASLNAWDISVQTDTAVLNPTTLTVAVDPFGANATTFSASEFVHCVNGAGSGCGITDGPGIVHSAIAGSGTPPVAPVNAILFTITYSVVATGGSYVHIFNDGLSLSGTTIAHTTQDGVYGSPANFSLTYAPTSVLGSYTVTATSLNGFAGSVSLSALSTSPVGLATSLTTANLALTSGGTASTTLKVSEGLSGTGQPAAPTGFYSVAVTGSSTVGGIPESRSAQINANLVYLSPQTQAIPGRLGFVSYLVKVANVDPFNLWDIAIK